MALVAGAALGLGMFLPDIRNEGSETEMRVLLGAVAFLGGVSVLGPPLLLRERPRPRGPWRAGRVMWFAQGMASWLLWPPVVVNRVRGKPVGDSMAKVCYAYGTPLMAVYVASALLAGGWLRPGRRRRRPLDWNERVGLVLAAGWACTGGYVLYLLYHNDLYGR